MCEIRRFRKWAEIEGCEIGGFDGNGEVGAVGIRVLEGR